MTLAIENVSLTNQNHSDLLEKIKQKTAHIGIIGMGYVGLPNMVSKARQGYTVTGFDIDQQKVDNVNKAHSYIEDVATDDLFELVLKHKKISATTNFEQLDRMDVIMICVPTPIDRHKQPILSYIKDATREIVHHAKTPALIILESTTYPGTTEDIIVTEFEKNNYQIGRDFFVAYSPERIDPSNQLFNVDNTQRVVGGHTPECTVLAAEFINQYAHTVSSTRTAEMSKVFENTFRYVNIALSNELAKICEKSGIDVWEVLEASKTKPFGFMPFYPSTGVGGHCIPVDPHYLNWFGKKFDHTSKLIDAATDINDSMLDYTLTKISQILNEQKKALYNSRIAIVGAAYKKNIGDVRESPIFKVYRSLRAFGAAVDVYDPYVDHFISNGERIEVSDVKYEALADCDMTLILTDHDRVEYPSVLKYSPCVFDTKNACKHLNTSDVSYHKL
ncbi:nucleotide sugar dehydrogenase [Geomicrobium sp. JSM 1781026]|uniref:nucleotide sugar dehydrogenase n=1 Tax=Geomicrobium sp. JSM 1781026 TaxID=3344580 RepID=UPI0035C226AE